MDALNTAYATDTGESPISRHFGDAGSYSIYEITANTARNIVGLDNSTESDHDDSGHGDGKKAGSSISLLKLGG